MKALPSRLMNSRSPRVVAKRNRPILGFSGRTIASTVMITRTRATTPKNKPVCQVQAIQSSCIYCVSSLLDAAHLNTVQLNPNKREALGDVIAHEPDDDGARDHAEHAGRRQQAPIHAR